MDWRGVYFCTLDLKISKVLASARPFHALIQLEKNDCPDWWSRCHSFTPTDRHKSCTLCAVGQ